jgi:hypothetical protein
VVIHIHQSKPMCDSCELRNFKFFRSFISHVVASYSSSLAFLEQNVRQNRILWCRSRMTPRPFHDLWTASVIMLVSQREKLPAGQRPKTGRPHGWTSRHSELALTRCIASGNIRDSSFDCTQCQELARTGSEQAFAASSRSNAAFEPVDSNQKTREFGNSNA